MKTSALFVIFGLVLLFCNSFAAELEMTGRGCGGLMAGCDGKSTFCCSGYNCSPTWKWCVYARPGRR
uniref:U1-theraphotoxin-Cg1a 2 n=1 Tax=Chilobrachys guangxiensis TaxID=278060 RepID=JZT7B_CHIGU|nr:RecName: Full=U1-theraphotoxin-Cg1a 2; Short=U1-TRTX-Cg1a; AltName: Full=Jingzhaotoxin-7.2; Short=JZTX-7.2; AltName: Full=Jingzhaotoxin-VII.2; Short=JZTX-VII.2; AltName: Full=Peptide F5-16.20; Flags: Precursor [Chilobrachys guangxiensis]ABY71654.1 cystine knot toxin [Chilobrachys guangxiensis]